MVACIALVLTFIVANPSLNDARDRTAVRDLLAAVTDSDEDVRSIAAELLGTEGRPGGRETGVLREVLASEDEAWRVRGSAATALGRLAARGDAEAVEALLDVIASEGADWRVRASALEAAWAVDDGRTVARLVRGQGAPLELVTPAGAIPLGAVSAATLEALSHPDARVRRLATLALLTTADEEAPPTRAAVVGALDDPDAVVRARAAALTSPAAEDTPSSFATPPARTRRRVVVQSCGSSSALERALQRLERVLHVAVVE